MSGPWVDNSEAQIVYPEDSKVVTPTLRNMPSKSGSKRQFRAIWKLLSDLEEKSLSQKPSEDLSLSLTGQKWVTWPHPAVGNLLS